jgi:hypothetical protein
MEFPHIPRPHLKKNVEKVKLPDMSNFATKEDIAQIVKRLDTAEKRKIWNNMSPRLKVKLINRIIAKRGEDGTTKKS